jgi:hypothetical protein
MPTVSLGGHSPPYIAEQNSIMNAISAKPPRGKRFFTVEEANRMLPLVRAIVQDMVQIGQDATLLQRQLTDLQGKRKEVEETRQRLGTELESLVEKWEAHRQELRDLGLEFKGAGVEGLVDFPAWVNGREVELCWKFDEPAVEHWHELFAGFAGRQPISTLNDEPARKPRSVSKRG